MGNGKNAEQSSQVAKNSWGKDTSEKLSLPERFKKGGLFSLSSQLYFLCVATVL